MFVSVWEQSKQSFLISSLNTWNVQTCFGAKYIEKTVRYLNPFTDFNLHEGWYQLTFVNKDWDCHVLFVWSLHWIQGVWSFGCICYYPARRTAAKIFPPSLSMAHRNPPYEFMWQVYWARKGFLYPIIDFISEWFSGSFWPDMLKAQSSWSEINFMYLEKLIFLCKLTSSVALISHHNRRFRWGRSGSILGTFYDDSFRMQRF